MSQRQNQNINISSSAVSSDESELLDDSWISATATHNYMMKDPLLDWLQYHHSTFTNKKKRYRKVVTKSLEDSKSTYNFTSYIMEQGNVFERKVIKLLIKKFGSSRVAEIHGEEGPRDPEKFRETLEAMNQGIPIIHSGVLHNPSNKTFGIPDLLIRSDWMKFLVKEAPLAKELEMMAAPNLKGKWHYRVVDIKFTSLLLRADASHLLNAALFPAYKAQLLIYNWALGYAQGYTPDQVYILGRRWKYTAQGETHTNDTCFSKFGVIDYLLPDHEYVERTNEALAWLREVRSDDAADWNIMKYPLQRWELYPNMCNSHDHPWHDVKTEIAEENKELTSLWMVGPKNRNIALKAGVCKWTDKKCSPRVLGINGEKTGRILSAIIKINRSDKVVISPKYISNNIGAWKWPDKIEFFVDFETGNGAMAPIKHLPAAQTGSIIVTIGVGYIEPRTREWIYKDFTVDRLVFSEEGRICREFSNYIRAKAREYKVVTPRCIHWAQAEDIMWTDAVDRHDPASDEWKSWMWDWLDLLTVFKDEPIVINGAMSFGLKEIASAMKQHGLINVSWDKNSACVDGQGAMIGALRAHNIASKSGISMKKVPIMKQIINYNKVDVRVLYEIITYLRENHLIKDTIAASAKAPKLSAKAAKQSPKSNPKSSSKPNSKKRTASNQNGYDGDVESNHSNKKRKVSSLSMLMEMNDSKQVITPTQKGPKEKQFNTIRHRYNFRSRT